MTTHIRTQDAKPKVMHQFTDAGSLGFPTGVKCWCGASLTFKLHEPGQAAKRRAFFDAHEECGPVESEGKS